MVHDELRRAFGRRQKAAGFGNIHRGGVGDVDQFIIGGHAFFFGIKTAAFHACQRHLRQLEVAKGADHGIHLPGHQRGRQRPVHIHQRHIGHRQPVRRQHRTKHGLLQPRHRKADLAALQVGQRFHRPVLQHQKAIQRCRDQRANPDQRHTFGHLKVQQRLIRNCQISLACRHHFGRIGGVCRGDDRHLQPGIGEIAVFLRDDDRPVIWVHEPVQHQGQLVLRKRGRGGQNNGQ